MKDFPPGDWVGMTPKRLLEKGVFCCPVEKVQARVEREVAFPVWGWWDRKLKPLYFAEGNKDESSTS